MTDSVPSHNFELNCYITQDGFDLANINFKAIMFNQFEGFNYGQLRTMLRHLDTIWYAQGNQIFLVGSEVEIIPILQAANYEGLSARAVPYDEMLSHRENILRFIIYAALDRLMRQKNFLPSIGGQSRTYYPQFDSVEDQDIELTHTVSQESYIVITKSGLEFHLDLSSAGRALLWIDTKLFTFVNHREDPLETGEPVYLMCDDFADCVASEHHALLEGAFVIDLQEDDELSVLPCVSPDTTDTLIVRSKSKEQIVQIPEACAYTTYNTRELKELGVYDWWRPRAIPPMQSRYEITQQLIKLITTDSDQLSISLPGNQKIVFKLQPISQEVSMRIP